jgi:hypothetical protein
MAFDAETFKAYIESDGQIPFDLHAQNPNDWAWLEEIIPGLIISSAGGLVPFQAEGIYRGHPFYYHDRHGQARLSIGELDGEIPYLGDYTIYTAYQDTEEWAGGKFFVRNLVQLVPNLKRSPFRYEFRGKKLHLANDKSWSFTVDESETETRSGWGFTPEEGYETLSVPSEYLMEHGATAEIQLAMRLAQEFDPTPVNKDERKYPEVDPDFVVNA